MFSFFAVMSEPHFALLAGRLVAGIKHKGPGRAHQAVVEDFVAAVRGGENVWGMHDGSLALSRALVLDACYQSAREQREVRL
jgi:predicted dehydrogenase